MILHIVELLGNDVTVHFICLLFCWFFFCLLICRRFLKYILDIHILLVIKIRNTFSQSMACGVFVQTFFICFDDWNHVIFMSNYKSFLLRFTHFISCFEYSSTAGNHKDNLLYCVLKVL